MSYDIILPESSIDGKISIDYSIGDPEVVNPIEEFKMVITPIPPQEILEKVDSGWSYKLLHNDVSKTEVDQNNFFTTWDDNYGAQPYLGAIKM